MKGFFHDFSFRSFNLGMIGGITDPTDIIGIPYSEVVQRIEKKNPHDMISGIACACVMIMKMFRGAPGNTHKQKRQKRSPILPGNYLGPQLLRGTPLAIR